MRNAKWMPNHIHMLLIPIPDQKLMAFVFERFSTLVPATLIAI